MYLSLSTKFLFDEAIIVPWGLMVPPATVVWPAPLKNATVISSIFASEHMSSTVVGNEDKLLSFSRASALTFPLWRRLLSPNKALMAFKVAVFPAGKQ